MKSVALITGGSRGIGLGIAKQLAQNNFDLAINGTRDQQEVESVLQELKSFGVDIIYCKGNIASNEARKNILQRVKNHFGKLHVLVNNAGIAPKERKDVLEASEESFDHVLSVNLKGPYFLMQQAANWMIEQKKSDETFQACIVNIT